MTPAEKKRLLDIPLVNENLVHHLKSIGVTKLQDLHGRDPREVLKKINEAAGHKALGGPMPLMALTNAVDAAEKKR